MPIRSVAIIGKRNEPLFLYSVNQGQHLYEETIIHSSLDIFEERRGPKAGAGSTPMPDLFLGNLLTVSRSKLFGFCSNTLVKVVVVTDIDGTAESVVKEFTEAVYDRFVGATRNPFQDTSSPITSSRFHEDIQAMLSMANGK